jgi:hypothetical protein
MDELRRVAPKTKKRSLRAGDMQNVLEQGKKRRRRSNIALQDEVKIIDINRDEVPTIKESLVYANTIPNKFTVGIQIDKYPARIVKVRRRQVSQLLPITGQDTCFIILNFLNLRDACIFMSVVENKKRRRKKITRQLIKQKCLLFPKLSLVSPSNLYSCYRWEQLFIRNQANLRRFIDLKCVVCMQIVETVQICKTTGLAVCGSCRRSHFRGKEQLKNSVIPEQLSAIHIHLDGGPFNKSGLQHPKPDRVAPWDVPLTSVIHFRSPVYSLVEILYLGSDPYSSTTASDFPLSTRHNIKIHELTRYTQLPSGNLFVDQDTYNKYFTRELLQEALRDEFKGYVPDGSPLQPITQELEDAMTDFTSSKIMKKLSACVFKTSNTNMPMRTNIPHKWNGWEDVYTLFYQSVRAYPSFLRVSRSW